MNNKKQKQENIKSFFDESRRHLLKEIHKTQSRKELKLIMLNISGCIGTKENPHSASLLLQHMQMLEMYCLLDWIYAEEIHQPDFTTFKFLLCGLIDSLVWNET